MSENNEKKMPPVEPEIAANIINYYSNYSEGHVMDLRIRDISRRLLHEEMVPPNHPVLNAIVDMHQPLQVKDYPALVNMFEKLGVYGWPPHDPLIYREDEPEDTNDAPSEGHSSEEQFVAEDGPNGEVPLNEDGLTPQEEIEQYMKQLEEEDARNNKGRTTQEQTRNRDSYKKSQDGQSNSSGGKDSSNNKKGNSDEKEEPKDQKTKGDRRTVSIDPVQAAFYQLLTGVNGMGSVIKKGVVNPVTGVARRAGRSDLNSWFDTKIERFNALQTEAESLVEKISNPETPQDEKHSLLGKSKGLFDQYANKLEDISEFSDKKIGVSRKKQLKEALERAKALTDTVEGDKNKSIDNKKLFENVSDVLKAITDLFKRIFSKGNEKQSEPAP